MIVTQLIIIRYYFIKCIKDMYECYLMKRNKKHKFFKTIIK